MGDIEAIRDAGRAVARVRERDLLAVVRALLDASRALVPDLDRVWLYMGPDRSGRGASVGADGAALPFVGGAAGTAAHGGALSVLLVVAGERVGEAAFTRASASWTDRDRTLLEIAGAMVAPLLARPAASEADPAPFRDGVTDELTGLYSGTFLERRLPALIGEYSATERPLSVAILAPDGLAEARRSLGPAAAASALRAYGSVLRAKLRGDDLAIRAGDEFVLILPETDVIGAMRTVERLRAALGQQPDAGSSFGFSAGIAALRAGRSAADLLAAARAELGQARALGAGEVRSEQPA